MSELLDILTLDRYKLIAFVLEYLVIFAAICADLSAGLRKAKRDGKMRTSFGFRKTLEKIKNKRNCSSVSKCRRKCTKKKR